MNQLLIQGEYQNLNMRYNIILFYRSRIKDVFEDGETVCVSLKDRSKKMNSEEEDWYEKAFGAK